ncbi:AgmX/PglI C-terminal domain-containing protein [Bermanella sp. R86510]|uniref:AgmX/PglI C-terminal domain-containing protein n=1 Tax=unclassified Bermanella TaxID=2627862 RepID=UPI0037C8E475
MATLQHRTPQLPWSDNQQEHLFKIILVALLVVTLALGILVPAIDLPAIDRHEAEEVPAQLARVIKRKKEAPKPKPVPKVQETPKPEKVEKPPEVKAKPKPQPKVVAAPPKPKVKPKPKPVSKAERTPERIKAAKEVARKRISEISGDLSEMRNMLDMNSLAGNNKALSNAGSAATAVGSVVNEEAVARVSGVDESTLTRETGAEKLATADRSTTQVEDVKQEALVDNSVAKQDTKPGMSRSQMQIRRVFEQNKSRFDRIYRRALRSNPILQGTVTLGVSVAANGEVTDCTVKETELDDKSVMRRMTMTCKMLAFDQANSDDEFEFPLTFAP